MAKTTSEAVNAFKEFVREHPELVRSIKEKDKTWKDVFDEWVLFGEDHEIWEEEYGIEEIPKKKPKVASELMRIFDFIGNLDTETVQERLKEIDGALTNIQDLIGQFSPNSNQQNQNFQSPYGMQRGPFMGMPPSVPNNNNSANQTPSIFQRD